MDKIDQGYQSFPLDLDDSRPYSGPDNSSWVVLQSAGGCKLNLTLNTSTEERTPLAHWGHAKSVAFQDELQDLNIPPALSKQCQGDESIVLSSKWTANTNPILLPNLTIKGYICSSTHTMAILPVTASVSASRFEVNFDKDTFSKKQRTVHSLLNISQLHALYTDPKQ
jgi:hypothetical protein